MKKIKIILLGILSFQAINSMNSDKTRASTLSRNLEEAYYYRGETFPLAFEDENLIQENIKELQSLKAIARQTDSSPLYVGTIKSLNQEFFDKFSVLLSQRLSKLAGNHSRLHTWFVYHKNKASKDKQDEHEESNIKLDILNINQVKFIRDSTVKCIQSLVVDAQEYDFNDEQIKKNFVKKPFSLDRALTYLAIKNIIKDNNFTSIGVPHKVLAIKDIKNNCYLQQSVACKLINDSMYLLLFSGSLKGRISLQLPNNYEISIYASIQKNYSENKLNKPAFEELKQLVKILPFDVGDTNIFTSKNGDAVIIDTETLNQTDSDECIAKLERYSHD